MSRSFNANFITEKNKRSGSAPINLMTFGFSTPVYLSDRDITPEGGSAHLGLIKKWGFIDSSIQQTSGQDLLGKIEQCDLAITIINSTSTRFSSYFTTADPLQGVDVILYQWFEGLLYSEKEILFKGTIYDSPAYDLYECKIVIRGIWEKYNKVIGENLIVNISDYPDAELSDVGKMLPLAWGTCMKVPFRGIEVGAVTTLADAINDSVTTFEISDSVKFDTSGIARIEDELITYTGASNNQLTGIGRGAYGSTAAAHDHGVIIKELLGEVVYATGGPIKAIDAVYIKDIQAGVYIRQIDNYIAYTGQTGDEHADYGNKGVIEFVGTVTIPTGAIVPFNDTVLPSGWAWFSDADGRMIVGAGDTYTVKDTGGDDAVSVTTNQDSHSGVSQFLTGEGGSGTPVGVNENFDPGTPGIASEHTHTVTFDYLPEYQDLKFIKASVGNEVFPAKAIVLTFTNDNPYPDKLTAILEDNRFLRANSSISTGGDSKSNEDVSTTDTHSHENLETFWGIGSDRYEYIVSGNHTHSTTFVSFSATESIKKTYLRAWTAVSSFPSRGNMILMYEGETAPEGWLLCDGTNNTPDLRDYFIKLSSDGNTGTQEGNNTVDFDYALSSGGEHTHKGDIYTSNTSESAYHDNENAHTHTDDDSSTSYTPPYYALTFIMKVLPDTSAGQNIVVADIDGYQDDGSGTYTGTPSALIEQPDHFFKHVWGNLLSASMGDINSSNFTTAGSFYNTNSYAMSLVVQDLIEASKLMAKVAFQFRSRCFVTPYGELNLLIRQLGQSSGHSIIKNEIKMDSVKINHTNILNVLNYFNIWYALDNGNGAIDKNFCDGATLFQDSTSISRYRQKSWKGDLSLWIFDAISDSDVIDHVGAYYKALLKDVRKIISLAIFLDNVETEPGDYVDITHDLDSMSGFVLEVLKIKNILGSGRANRIDHVELIGLENQSL